MPKKPGRWRRALNFIRRHEGKLAVAGIAGAIAALALSPKGPSREVRLPFRPPVKKVKAEKPSQPSRPKKPAQPKEKPKLKLKKMPVSGWRLYDMPFRVCYDAVPVIQKYPDRSWTVWKDFIRPSKATKKRAPISKGETWRRVKQAFAGELRANNIALSELDEIFRELWKVRPK